MTESVKKKQESRKSMKDYYFKAEKLSVGYHKQPIIEEIEIGLEKGKILTLIGPNGAGKSTVLKSIAGQLALLGGTIFLDGRDREGFSGRELSQSMAILLTDRLRTEMMTCEEVVATGRYPYTGRFGILTPRDHQAVEEAMELVQVQGIRHRDFTKISDGQRQRVMLARAICQEPEIIILDEPTSYLDVRYKLEFLSVLQNMQKVKRVTVIMSLHELELADRISDKIMCINKRYVDRLGTPAEIFEPGYISRLFGLSSGSFDEENMSMELSPVKANPTIFVIAGGGRGREVYRKLQRQGEAFVTGILFSNDLDHPVARALAAEVITAEAFEPVAYKLVEEAKEKIDGCERVICCKKYFGTYEFANRELLLYAKEKGKLIQFSEFF